MDINGSASRFSGFRQCHRRRRVASGLGSEDADLLLGVGNQPRQCYRRTSIAFGPGSEHGDRLGIRNNLASSIAARASRFMCGLSISNFLSGLEINFVSSIAPGTCRAWGG